MQALTTFRDGGKTVLGGYIIQAGKNHGGGDWVAAGKFDLAVIETNSEKVGNSKKLQTS